MEEVLRSKISKLRKDLFSEDEIPKKREKREKEQKQIEKKKAVLHFTNTNALNNTSNVFSTNFIKRTRAEMRDTFIE